MKIAWGGFVNWALGIRFVNVIRQNIDYLVPVYKQLYDFDFEEFITNLKGIHEFDEKLNWRIYGCKSLEEYHHKYSTATFIKNIKVPTLFFFANDDPIISKNCIEFEKSM